MSIDIAALDRVADRFFDVAFDPAGWTPALDALSDAVGATGIILFATGGKLPTPGPFPFSTGLTDLVATYMNQGWHAADERYRGAPALLRRGVFTDDDCMAPELRLSHPFYQEFIRAGGFDGFAGLRLHINGTVCCASMHRSVGQAPFTPEDLATLVAAAPRLSMATSILSQIDRARIEGMGDMLEAMTTPAFLLDGLGVVVRANAAAATVIGRGVDVCGGQLVATGPDKDALPRLVAQVLAPGERAAPQAGAVLPIRRAGGRPLLVRVLRLRSTAALDYLSRARLIVTVTDPDRKPRPTADRLQAVLPLTAREAALLVLLVEADGDLRAVADRAGVTYETMRSHLKNLHAKAETHSITELLALAARLSAAD